MLKILSLIFLLFLLFFPQQTFAEDRDVVINEVYYQGGNQQEWVELYNKGTSSVTLDGWSIEDNYSSDPIPLTTISSGGFAVIITSNSTVSNISSSAVVIKLSGLTIGNGLANTGDKVILKNSSGEIDSMSYGSNTTIFTLSEVDVGHSYERIPAGTDTNSANDFIDQSSPTPGSGTSSTPSPTPASPSPSSNPPPPSPSSPPPKPSVSSTPTPIGTSISVSLSDNKEATNSVLSESTPSSKLETNEPEPTPVETQVAAENNLQKILIAVGLLFIISSGFWFIRSLKKNE